jgi:hypothetical protein
MPFHVFIGIGYYLILTVIISRFISITTGRILMANPRRLFSTHTPGTSKGIFGPLKAVSTEYNLHSSSQE